MTAEPQMAETIPQLFFRQAKRFGPNPLMWAKINGRYVPLTWDLIAKGVKALGAFLLQQDVQRGDRVAILSENRPEWGIADLAIQQLGAWTVPLYPSLSEADILQILSDCEPVVCVASTNQQAQKLRAVCPKVPSIRAVIVMDADRSFASHERSWAQAIEEGEGAVPKLADLLSRRMQQLHPDETATLIYTSGTTGEPKGVMLSHRNFLSNASACLKAIPISSRDRHLSFLPLSHVFERMAGWYLMLMAGASVAYAEDMEALPKNMLEVRPTVMLGVPRFFEKLHARLHEAIRQAPPSKQRIIEWALSIGREAGSYRLARRPIPLGLWGREWLAAQLVFRKFHHRLGGRLRFFVSGSAPLAKAIGEFFYSVHVAILEGYGLTETSPVITVNRVTAVKFGSVGLPIDGVELRLEEDGEIVTKGPHVMQGYYRKPEATRAAIVEGWLHTGDIGTIDAEGFLSITDRKKDLIKTAGGKFVAPQKLENLFVTDPYIAQAFLYGDREPYCVALIVPRFERLVEYAKAHGMPSTPQELVRAPAIRELLWGRVQVLQQDLPSFEQIKAIALLDQEFTQAAGELTPTLKAKRAAIALRYHDLIRRLYEESARSPAAPTPSCG